MADTTKKEEDTIKKEEDTTKKEEDTTKKEEDTTKKEEERKTMFKVNTVYKTGLIMKKKCTNLVRNGILCP